MDYFKMTAPCGLDCFNCDFFLARTDSKSMARVETLSEQYHIPVEIMLCSGCRKQDGRIALQIYLYGEEHRCAAYECSKQRNLDFCGDCEQFPCDSLRPYADKASELPHNIKVYNLCLINKMGLHEWAETKAADVRQAYFNEPWTLSH